MHVTVSNTHIVHAMYPLLLSVIFYPASYIIFEAQMTIIWCYLKRKSELQINAIDLINRDTLISHNVTISLVHFFTFMIHQYYHENAADYFPNPVKLIFLCLSLLFYASLLMTLSYYSLGITLRYYLIITKQTCVSEDFTDGDIRNIARFIIFAVAASASIMTAVFGAFPDFYHDLTHEPGQNKYSLVILIAFLSMSISSNIIFRTLIFMYKKKYAKNAENVNDADDANSVDGQHAKAGLAIFLLLCIFAVFMVFLILYQEEKDKILVIRIFMVTCTGNVALFIYIIANDGLSGFIFKSFKNIALKRMRAVSFD